MLLKVGPHPTNSNKHIGQSMIATNGRDYNMTFQNEVIITWPFVECILGCLTLNYKAATCGLYSEGVS